MNHMLDGKRGFTLIEILLVIGVITILAAIVIIAINPARQFAQARNIQRQTAIKSISDSISQYLIDYRGKIPLGIDSDLKMIGTAASNCSITCGDVEETANWYNPDWFYRKKITIDYSKVETDLTDFPVMVSITDNNLSDKAQSNGNYILFASSDGSKLDHEIEYYNNATGELLAWVKTDLSSSTKQNIEGTWSNGFAMVQHLNEASGSYLDSSSNNNDGVLTDSDLDSVRATVGKIGRGIDFNGDADYITIPDNTTLDLNALTVEAWVKFDVVTGYLTQKTRNGSSYQTNQSNWNLQTRTGNRMRSGSGDCSGGYYTGDGPTTVTTGNWYYFVR